MKKNKKLRIIQLSALIFLTISGGPYGLESLISYVGNNGALVLLLITPILWDIPTILTVLELNSLMPVTGGYYQWVKHALGLRFAWYEGWWTWLYTFVDLAIYPVLFMEYLTFFAPEAQSFKIPICLLIIWGSGYLNIRGILLVGKTAVLLGFMVLTPFVILLFYYLFNYNNLPEVVIPYHNNSNFSAIGLGLYTIMWNFLGWDNVTTYAEEVSKPIRTYLISVITAFSTIFIVYLFVILISIHSGIDHSVLSEKGFPALGEIIAGRWLGIMMAIGGMASGLGLYSSVLLSVSRVPQAMAEDSLLPKKLHTIHPKYETPYFSIFCCSVVVSFMVVFPFSELIIMDVIIYGAALFLEFISLIVLRHKMSLNFRPFRIPLKIPGLILMILLPVSVYITALTGTLMKEGGSIRPVIIAICMLFTAEILWRLIIWRNPNILKSPSNQTHI